MGTYRQINGLRFFAVSFVIFHHICGAPLSAYFSFGTFGVDLFFVISGFLITEILIREKLKNKSASSILKTFFMRRVLRIFPLYYLYILICFLIVPVQTATYACWLLTYTINIYISLKGQLAFWYFTHLWSLGVEEQFYLFWPFLIIFIPLKRLKTVFTGMIIFAVLYRFINIFYIEHYHLFNYTMLPAALDCFGAGALLAYLKAFQPQLLEKLLALKFMIFAGIILSVLNNRFGIDATQEAFSRFLVALVSFYLVGITATIQFKSVTKAVLENKAVMYIGKISYGMYIFHLLIWGIFGPLFTTSWQHLFPQLPPECYTKSIFEFIFISILTFIVSAIVFELFEKNVLKLKKHFSY